MSLNGTHVNVLYFIVDDVDAAVGSVVCVPASVEGEAMGITALFVVTCSTHIVEHVGEYSVRTPCLHH